MLFRSLVPSTCHSHDILSLMPQFRVPPCPTAFPTRHSFGAPPALSLPPEVTASVRGNSKLICWFSIELLSMCNLLTRLSFDRSGVSQRHCISHTAQFIPQVSPCHSSDRFPGHPNTASISSPALPVSAPPAAKLLGSLGAFQRIAARWLRPTITVCRCLTSCEAQRRQGVTL